MCIDMTVIVQVIATVGVRPKESCLRDHLELSFEKQNDEFWQLNVRIQ